MGDVDGSIWPIGGGASLLLDAMAAPLAAVPSAVDTLPAGRDVLPDLSLVVPESASRWLRGALTPSPSWLVAQLAAMAMAGLSVGFLSGTNPAWAAFLVLTAMTAAWSSRRQLVNPIPQADTQVARGLAFPYAVVTVAAAFDVVGHAAMRESLWIVAASQTAMLSALFVSFALRRAVRLVVVGSAPEVARTKERLAVKDRAQVVAGVLVDASADGERALDRVDGLRTTKSADRIVECAQRHDADLIVVLPSAQLSASEIRQLSWQLERTRIGVGVAGTVDASPHRLESVRIGGEPVLSVLPSRQSASSRIVKTTLDRVLGLLLLVVLLPILGSLLLAIRLDSTGSGLFRQVRVGKDGRPFLMYKLRTMCLHAERERDALVENNQGSGLLFKIHDDPRVTRIGRLLRRTSLDELPQLINVVRGEMSLVGPRPALHVEVEAYTDVERRRLAVRPGMTGLWQVSGRSDLDWDEGISLDLRYADNWRLRDDLSIAARTLGAVTHGRGAY